MALFVKDQYAKVFTCGIKDTDKYTYRNLSVSTKVGEGKYVHDSWTAKFPLSKKSALEKLDNGTRISFDGYLRNSYNKELKKSFTNIRVTKFDVI